jgi:hypothetical protein
LAHLLGDEKSAGWPSKAPLSKLVSAVNTTKKVKILTIKTGGALCKHLPSSKA